MAYDSEFEAFIQRRKSEPTPEPPKPIDDPEVLKHKARYDKACHWAAQVAITVRDRLEPDVGVIDDEGVRHPAWIITKYDDDRGQVSDLSNHPEEHATTYVVGGVILSRDKKLLTFTLESDRPEDIDMNAIPIEAVSSLDRIAREDQWRLWHLRDERTHSIGLKGIENGLADLALRARGESPPQSK